MSHTGDGEGSVLFVKGEDVLERFGDVSVVRINDFTLLLLALGKRSVLFSAEESQNFRNVPSVIERLHEVNGMLDILDEFLNEKTTPEFSRIGSSTFSIGKSSVRKCQLLHLLHSILNIAAVVTVIISIEEESSVGNHSEFTVGLASEVVTPEKSSNAGIERPNHHHFFPVLQEVDLIQICNCFLDILRSSKVKLLSSKSYRVAVACETTPVTAFDDDLGPVIKVASLEKTQDASQEELAIGPIDGRGSINQIILDGKLMAFLNAGGQVVLHAPAEIDLLPENEYLIGDDIEIDRVRYVGVDRVGRAIKTHSSVLLGQLNLVEHRDRRHPQDQHSSQTYLQHDTDQLIKRFIAPLLHMH